MKNKINLIIKHFNNLELFSSILSFVFVFFIYIIFFSVNYKNFIILLIIEVIIEEYKILGI